MFMTLGDTASKSLMYIKIGIDMTEKYMPKINKYTCTVTSWTALPDILTSQSREKHGCTASH